MFSGIDLQIFQEEHMNLICNMSSEIALMKSLPHISMANELSMVVLCIVGSNARMDYEDG